MRLYQPGDRSAGICEHCRRKVSTRMEYRDYTPTGWKATVPDVLVASCESCGAVVNVPHQSMTKINAHRSAPPALETIQARLPRVLEDALGLVTAILGGQAKAVQPAIVRYYLTRVAEDPMVATAVRLASAQPIAQGLADGRLAVKIAHHQWKSVQAAVRAAGFTSKSQLLRGIVVLAAEDCKIDLRRQGVDAPRFDEAARTRFNDLKTLAKAV
jgi:hypothetical protein